MYGSAFVKAPRKYQWILALFNPIFPMFFTKFILEVAYRSAGESSKGKKTIKNLAAHYVSTKHAMFLGAIVGGVATPESSLCIMATDLAKALNSGWKIIKKQKSNPENIEGNFFIRLLLC